MKDVTHGDDDYIIIIAAGVNVLKGFFVIKVTRSDDVPDDVNLRDLLIYSGDDYLECVDHGSSIGYGWVNYGKSYEYDS
ncbi:hypothetical protein Tco_1486874 [Tanacetum coccineum]